MTSCFGLRLKHVFEPILHKSVYPDLMRTHHGMLSVMSSTHQVAEQSLGNLVIHQHFRSHKPKGGDILRMRSRCIQIFSIAGRVSWQFKLWWQWLVSDSSSSKQRSSLTQASLGIFRGGYRLSLTRVHALLKRDATSPVKGASSTGKCCVGYGGPGDRATKPNLLDALHIRKACDQ